MSAETPQTQPNIPAQFLAPYNPQDHETKLYAMWENSGYFNPDTCIKDGLTAPDAETFSIVLPPPNVTGTLHMGHAAMLAVCERDCSQYAAHRLQNKKLNL